MSMVSFTLFCVACLAVSSNSMFVAVPAALYIIGYVAGVPGTSYYGLPTGSSV